MIDVADTDLLATLERRAAVDLEALQRELVELAKTQPADFVRLLALVLDDSGDRA